jgi:hypothetical protein
MWQLEDNKKRLWSLDKAFSWRNNGGNSMVKVLRLVAGVALGLMLADVVLAQRPRTMTQDKVEPTTAVTPPPAAPPSVKAKYEGGVFGYNKKMEGTLNFDDPNQRLVFKDGKQKEILFVPYAAITGAFADTHSVQPAAATVAGNVPSIYALPAKFIKTKVRYLTVQYNDPDSKVSGITSFRLENKDILDSVLNTLAGKAGLNRRGEVFVRKKE